MQKYRGDNSKECNYTIASFGARDLVHVDVDDGYRKRSRSSASNATVACSLRANDDVHHGGKNLER